MTERNHGATGGSKEWDKTQAILVRVWANRSRSIKIAAICCLLSTAAAFLLPSRYVSTVRLMPPDPPSSPLSMLMAGASGNSSGFAGIASSLLGAKTSGAMFVAVLQSRTVSDRLINGFDLRRYYGVRTYEAAREKLASRVVIEEDRKSGVISITVRDKDRNRAAELASAYVQQLDALVSEVSTSAARRERIFLEERLNAVKADLDRDSEALAAFSSKNALVDPSGQAKAMSSAVADLQGQLIAAESELQGLQQIYTDNNIRIKTLRARIAELERQIQKINGKSGDASDISAKELYPQLRKLPIISVRYADLYRRAKVQEALFEVLTKQYELAKVQEAKDIPVVKVLDAPIPAEKRSFPPRLALIVGGFALGLIAGIASVLIEHKWEELDDHDPSKVFLREAYSFVRSRNDAKDPKSIGRSAGA